MLLRRFYHGSIFCILVTTIHSAPVTWQAPFNITDVNGIDTSGTHVEAKNATNDGTSPTVNVGGENITFQGMNFGVSATSTGTYFTGGGGDTGNADLNTVFNSHVWSGSAWSFNLSGLTSGTEYQIQVIAGADTRGCCAGRNQRAGDDESPENVSGDYSRSGVGSVIGTFTASGASQTIRILPGIVNGSDPSMSAYILRETAPPTPQPPNDITLSNTDLPPSMPAGSAVGTLTTTDPNPADTHTYTFVDTGSFPDNNLFTVVSGDELQTSAALGGFGTSYQIKLRTTDNGGLFYEEVITLQVEAAMPPTALNLSANTVLRTTPVGGVVGGFSTVDGNASDTHSYTLVPGTGDTDNGLFAINGSALEVAGSLPGVGSALSIRVRSTDLSGLFIEEIFPLTVVDSSVRINEFLANNTATSLMDEDGDTPDWVELHNPDGGSVSLNGWYLTDDPLNLTKWQFPNVSIAGNGFVVVFASSKNRTPTSGNLHTNFSLGANGEYVALVAADGTTIMTEFGSGGADYPPQKANVTYGFFGNPLQIGFMLNPTPNAANDSGSGVLGFVADTQFDIDRGFFDTPFNLTISTATPGATIRYTTDGSWPDETTGTIYTGPITIDRSTPVKAIAYKAGFVSTNVDTQTYIFVDSILAQTSANTQSVYGLPSFSNQYYGMNNNPAVNPQTHPTIANDLKTIPSLSIAIDSDDMFGPSGIYTNPNSSGTAWERKTSLELIDPADPTGATNFQLNCAIRIQGGAFRSFGLTRKKSFRVLFKSQFGTSNLPTGGPGSLNYPMFGTEPGVAQEFQTLTFRMESNDGWQWSGANGQPQYARDEFGRRAQLALGQPSSHGRYLHLHINGVYWGVYNVVERPDSGFAESYIDGAVRELWEGQNSGNPINDAINLNFWNSYKSAVAPISSATTDAQRDAIYLQACGFNADGTRNAAFPIWCDPSNTADYFLVNWYSGNSDWPQKNYYGGIDTQPTRTGYKYFMWDSEWSLFLRSNTNTNRITDYRGIADPNDDLEESPEYQIRFADRAHRALFNSGPLTPSGARALYDEVTAQHTSILVPEAARWGNQHNQQRDVGDWQNEYNNIVNNWFPVRADIFISQLRSADLYPNIDAPTYSQHGGSVPMGSGPTLIVPQTVSQIYYMYGPGDSDLTDYEHSLDPRLVGGSINPAATLITLSGGGGPTTTVYIDNGDNWKYLADGSNQGTGWRGVGFNDSSWPSGPSELGYGDNDEATDVGFVDVDPGTAGDQKNATTYFRKVVNIVDPSPFADFTIDITYDDSYAIYVNGNEVARHSGLSANAPYNEYSSNSVGNNATATHTLATNSFASGNNTIAVEMHQTSNTSSDVSFDMTLTGNPPGGGSTHASDPLVLNTPGWLFSRSYNSTSGEWSALNTAFFTIDTVPADATNLVISEFHYHPAEPTLPAETAISMDRDDYEFVEFMNIGPQPIDLTNVSFSDGITYFFPSNTVLQAGARFVIARNTAAFAARYGSQPDDVYTGRLSNDGETLILDSNVTGNILNFTYNDQLPWPVIADGDGPSLVLINPAQPAPDHGVASNWAASGDAQGSPGTAGSVGFTGDPSENLDDDDLSAFIEFALGTSDTDGTDTTSAITASVAPHTVGMNTDDYLTLIVQKNLLAHNIVDFQAEVSTELVIWSGPPSVVFVSETENGDGTATLVWRSAIPMSAGIREFIRLRATQL